MPFTVDKSRVDALIQAGDYANSAAIAAQHAFRKAREHLQERRADLQRLQSFSMVDPQVIAARTAELARLEQEEARARVDAERAQALREHAVRTSNKVASFAGVRR